MHVVPLPPSAHLLSRLGFLTFSLWAWAGVASAADVNTGYFGNVAIRGYDPVAYFTDRRPTKGTSENSVTWLGATWYFASPAHRDTFVSEPIRYAPQYGGFCTLGMAVGEASANVDPEAWRIVGGKLYLFSGKEGIEEDFDSAAADVIAKADAMWPEVKQKDARARQQDGN
jgi:YHS domain-containing protein